MGGRREESTRTNVIGVTGKGHEGRGRGEVPERGGRVVGAGKNMGKVERRKGGHVDWSKKMRGVKRDRSLR